MMPKNLTGTLNNEFFEDNSSFAEYEDAFDIETSSFSDDMAIMFEGPSSDSILPEEVKDYKEHRKKISEYEKNILKLEEYSNFKDNWYGENDAHFEAKTICLSKKILPNLLKQPEIFPARDGSIQMEFESADYNKYFQINVYKDYVSLYTDFDGTEREKDYNDQFINREFYIKLNNYIKVF